jgi:hypothetical protein
MLGNQVYKSIKLSRGPHSFFDQIFQGVVFYRYISLQALETRQLGFHFFPTLELSCTHAALLRFPVVVGGFRDIVFSTDILYLDISIWLIEDQNNLCFGKSRFYHLILLVRALFQKAPLLNANLLG